MNMIDILKNDAELSSEIFEIYSKRVDFNLNAEEKFEPKSIIKREEELNELGTLKVFVRPTLLVKKDDFIHPSSTTFVNRMGKQPYLQNIRKAIFASGRLDMQGVDAHLGTAWVVAPKIIVTNRHVLTKKGEGKVLYSDVDIVEKITIDFK